MLERFCGLAQPLRGAAAQLILMQIPTFFVIGVYPSFFCWVQPIRDDHAKINRHIGKRFKFQKSR